MADEFFTDRELGKKPQISEQIPFSILKGIVAVCDQYKSLMLERFPDNNNSNFTEFNEVSFNNLRNTLIPDFTCDEFEYDCDESSRRQYALLDYIEFCSDSIGSSNRRKYDEYQYIDEETNKTSFREDINQIFQRRGITFALSENGEIQRILPIGLDRLVRNYCHKGNDLELNNLIDQALVNIIKPKLYDRQTAIEKLWDAFERIKTCHPELKKAESAKRLIEISTETPTGTSSGFYNLLDAEMKALTVIGNSFKIRHHETDQVKINNVDHIDYLFYRMMAILSLLLKNI